MRFEATILNADIGFTSITQDDSSWSRDHTTYQLDDYSATLWRAESRNSAGRLLSRLVIEGVSEKHEGVEVTNDLCRLLEFVGMSQIRPCHYSWQGQDECFSVSAVANRYRPVLQLEDGEAVKSYLEQVWGQFIELKACRGLHALIDMLVLSDLPNPIETQHALLCIVLENLKATFAKQKKYPFEGGFWRPETGSEKRLSFKRLLEEMTAEINMSMDFTEIVEFRNEMLHYGLSEKPANELFQHHDLTHDFVREYLIRLLGYRGRYRVYSKASRVSAKIQ